MSVKIIRVAEVSRFSE